MQPTLIMADVHRASAPIAAPRPPIPPLASHRSVRSRMRELGRPRPAGPVAYGGEIVIRAALVADAGDVLRLAELDERPVPAGELLLAELDGEVTAALPLNGGEPVADPFHPAAELLSLLALRADQMRAEDRRGSKRRRGLRPAVASDC